MARNIEKAGIRKNVWDFIPSISKAEDIATLFSILGYPQGVIYEKPLQRKKELFEFRKEDLEKIRNIYSPMSFGEDIPVFLIETSSLTPAFIRSTTSTLDHQYLQFMAIFTINYSEIVFVYPRGVKDESGKHNLKITKLVLNKADLHYTQIQTLARIHYSKDEDWRAVWGQWGEAFNVKSVTEKFFEDYKQVFFRLRETISTNDISVKEAHEFSLQFLNRMMFIYFIAKKEWLKQSHFVKWLWEAYKSGGNYGSNTFYLTWLSQVFFKAFNNKKNDIRDLPDDVARILLTVPYLNGGLFVETEVDTLGITIADELLKDVISFFESYNFTIREDMPFDEEVAVDPQMIGYVYESLANVAEEIYDRNDLGIFYTSRVEVDLMCRRALVGSLINRMPDMPREALYHFVFDAREDRGQTSHLNGNSEIWFKIEQVLDDLSIVDPACGSGAFLVGMLNVLSELYQVVYVRTAPNTKLSLFDIKYNIIQRSLCGVDVMPWAVRAAELRLWLQLAVDTELSLDNLRKGPLLPNLNLKLRVGDSMVQELGGVSFNIRTKGLDEGIRRDLERLKQEKNRFFEGSGTRRYRVAKEFCRVETSIFLRIIDSMVKRLEKEIKKSEERLAAPTKQFDLSGKPIRQVFQTDLKEEISRKEIETEITRLKEEIHRLKSVKSVLDDPEKKPFIWDIDFAEIFAEKNGFDIVIGNPPYVRQEMISPPNRFKAEVTLEDRREYKEKLINSVRSQFPMIKNIDRKSDLYIYFYFHGLSLLNEKGIFCFITSNSWLDVGYGKELQEFLLRSVPIHAIYDNPKRSFEHADVNTIIAVFGAPALREESFEEKIRTGENASWTKLSNTARFVMFKKPFEEVISAETMITIDNAEVTVKGAELADLVENVVQAEACRVFPVMQEDLLEDGWEYPDEYDRSNGRFRRGEYIGNKWGGKYLRAPDIFYTVLKKGKGKLLRLGDVAKVRFGIKTGANDFFYLDEEAQKKWKIENKFLKPVIKSPRELKSIYVRPDNLKFKTFICNLSKTELEGTNALKYIEWGEKAQIKIGLGAEKGKSVCGYQNLKSISSRKRWYSIDSVKGNMFWVKESNNRLGCFISTEEMSCDCRLYYGNAPVEILNSVNSTLVFLFTEVLSRSNLGLGAKSLMVFEVNQFLVPYNIEPLHSRLYLEERPLLPIFDECGLDVTKPIREQKPKPVHDRLTLDSIIFDAFGLNKEERDEVYYSVCELVKGRLDKAGSIKGKEV